MQARNRRAFGFHEHGSLPEPASAIQSSFAGIETMAEITASVR